MINKNIFSLTDFISNTEEMSLNNLQRDQLLPLLEKMILIRHAEVCLAKGKEKKLIVGPVHLGVGQEAIPVGVSSSLKKTDQVFGNHRSHSHLLSLGSNLRKLFSEILGKENGLAKGRGGSMHLIDRSVGFSGSVPIVAGTLSVAAGAALASKLQNLNSVVVAYFGDGAVEEGVFHETLNFAKIHALPLLFVAENNFFASHMHISERQASNCTARFAAANNIDFKVIDGNDVVQIKKISDNYISKCRNGEGPFYLEAITFRWYGHVDWREDIDVGINRSKEEIQKWKQKDPIKRLKDLMLSSKIIDENEIQELEEKILETVKNSWHDALDDPYPKPESLCDHVYRSVNY